MPKILSRPRSGFTSFTASSNEGDIRRGPRLPVLRLAFGLPPGLPRNCGFDGVVVEVVILFSSYDKLRLRVYSIDYTHFGVLCQELF